MRDDDEIDNTCERLIRLAVFAMETSTTSVDRLQLAALEAAVVGLDSALAERHLVLAIAMAREGAIEIVWRCLRAHCL
jgi:hypothetical protein